VLSIDVLNSGYKPTPPGPGWDVRLPATWPATTSTLIAGEHDAILVDALATTAEGNRLVTWLRQSGKQLRAIVVTHGHFDHFFGAGPVVDAFPGSRLVTCDQRVVDEARGQTTPGSMARWNALFPGQLPASPPIPSWTGAGDLDIDGSPVQLWAIGGADGMLATIAYVPELHAVCSGDIAYNNIHMWLWNSTPDSRKAWLASLDAVAAFKPVTIVTGHKDPDAPDDDAGRVLDQSRRYLEDFEQGVNVAETPQELIDRMLAKYPAYGNRHTLWAAAYSQFT
jgi:glyoxylase-like metal-dependent hydrolase (beta-lactamase superfamily II)